MVRHRFPEPRVRLGQPVVGVHVFRLDLQSALILGDRLPQKIRGAYAENSAVLAPQLVAALRAGDVVLVKGSFGSRMAVIVDALKTREAATA